MKKTLFMIAALGLMLAACDETKQDTPTTFAINTITMDEYKDVTDEQIEDWFGFQSDYIDLDELARESSIHVELDMPVTNNATLQENIENFIISDLDEEELAAMGNLGDGHAFLQMKKDQFYHATYPVQEESFTAKLAEETDNYVTYIKEKEGNYFIVDDAFSEGATFAKKTGKPFTWDMFTNMDGIFALIDEYNDGYEYIFPEPYINPWIQNGNVYIIYERNDAFDEVCNFTFDQVKNFLTKEGQEYFAIKTKD